MGTYADKIATSTDKAASPLRHIESGMAGGHLAFKDREQLYTACTCVKERLQETQEKFRVHQPQARPPFAQLYYKHRSEQATTAQQQQGRMPLLCLIIGMPSGLTGTTNSCP